MLVIEIKGSSKAGKSTLAYWLHRELVKLGFSPELIKVEDDDSLSAGITKAMLCQSLENVDKSQPITIKTSQLPRATWPSWMEK